MFIITSLSVLLNVCKTLWTMFYELCFTNKWLIDWLICLLKPSCMTCQNSVIFFYFFVLNLTVMIADTTCYNVRLCKFALVSSSLLIFPLSFSISLCPGLTSQLIISCGHTVWSALHLDSATAEGGGRQEGEEGKLRGAEEIWVTLEAIMMA